MSYSILLMSLLSMYMLLIRLAMLIKLHSCCFYNNTNDSHNYCYAFYHWAFLLNSYPVSSTYSDHSYSTYVRLGRQTSRPRMDQSLERSSAGFCVRTSFVSGLY